MESLTMVSSDPHHISALIVWKLRRQLGRAGRLPVFMQLVVNGMREYMAV